MHWRPHYYLVFKKAIQGQLKKLKKLSDPIQILYDAIDDDAKDVKVNLKFASHDGHKVKIEGIIIKTKAFHFPIIVHILNKLPKDFLDNPYQIITNNIENQLNIKKKKGYEDIMMCKNTFVDQLCIFLV